MNRPRRTRRGGIRRFTQQLRVIEELDVLALVPIALGMLLVGMVATGFSGAGLLAVRQVLRMMQERSRELSRRLSEPMRRLSSGLLEQTWVQKLWYPVQRNPRKAVGAAIALVTLRALQQLRAALRDFDFSLRMNEPEVELDPDLRVRLDVGETMGPWGQGLPETVPPGVWRPFLNAAMTAQENIEAIRARLGLVSRDWRDMTLDQIAEGVRRVQLQRLHDEIKPASISGKFCSQEQAESIALALAEEADIPTPYLRGGLEECVVPAMRETLPVWTPAWVGRLQRLVLGTLLRAFFHGAWSFKSRFVQTPHGRMHVLDSGPPPLEGQAKSQPAEPPLVLSHGMWVTGWSMMFLAWPLSRRRRVVVPDLFDFEYGFSRSTGSTSGGKKVRSVVEHVDALLALVRDVAASSGTPGGTSVDIAGHSFGGFLIGVLARRCCQEGLPLRKVVLLGPGGPLCRFSDPWFFRLVSRPPREAATALASLSRVPLPVSLVEVALKCVLGILFSANNSNVLFGLPYQEYLGSSDTSVGSDKPTLLLWGDKDTLAHPRRPKPLGKYMAERFPKLDAYWIEGGAHNIQMDSAAVTAQVMDSWLAGDSSVNDSPVVARSGFGFRNFFRWTNRRIRPMNFDQDDEEEEPSEASEEQSEGDARALPHSRL